jgi:hypothetical protein
MNKKELKSLVSNVIREEMGNMLPMAHKDHEASMAKSELRDMLKNGADLYKDIQEGQELPGWVSAYITLASDYIHSVYGWMEEQKSN